MPDDPTHRTHRGGQEFPRFHPDQPPEELEELPPPPGSRAAGADPHDVMGHEVDYEGQDCPRCRDQANRELEAGQW